MQNFFDMKSLVSRLLSQDKLPDALHLVNKKSSFELKDVTLKK